MLRHQGLPPTFWVVMKPTENSEFDDICFKSSITTLMTCARGGMDENRIIGFFVNENIARMEAKNALQRR